MEIIEHGNTYKIQTCMDCLCEFSYTKKDISYSGYDKEVRCPECGKCIKVGEVY